MPNYDYQCTHCGHKEEVLQKMTDDSLTVCPQCLQSSYKRKFGVGIGLQFQGSGFYSTDYPPQSSSSSSGTENKAPTSPPKGCGCGKTSCSS
jgi:putative FmdB family regulatory protein